MTRKMWWAAAVVAAVAVGAAYVGSPFLAANGLRAAAQSGDVDKLQRLVDFPAVRESLKGQLNAMVVQAIQSDPDLKDNPFAGIAAVMAPAIVNQAIDGYVTSEGIAAMMAANRPAAPVPAPGNGSSDKGRPREASHPETGAAFEHGYKDLDTYVITSVNAADPKARFSFVMHRRGLFDWRLTRIELPKDLMAKPAAEVKPGARAETAVGTR